MLFSHNAQNLSSKERDTTIVSISWLDDGDEEQSIPLEEAIIWLSSELAKIPAEHRGSAKLKVSGYGEYVHVYAGIEYLRPETDEEMQERLDFLNEVAYDSERYERATYKLLKAKYEK